MDRFERIQAQRDLRLALKNTRGAWGVVKVNEDGRRIVVLQDLKQTVAEKIAGKKRDEMSDADVGAGWDYVVERIGWRFPVPSRL